MTEKQKLENVITRQSNRNSQDDEKTKDRLHKISRSACVHVPTKITSHASNVKKILSDISDVYLSLYFLGSD